LTDGRSNNPKSTDAIAERLKRSYGIVIQAVGIGRNINMNELRDVASAPVVNNAIRIDDYNGLASVARLITQKCSNPVFNPGSKCDFNEMVKCTLGRRTPCDLVTAYQQCAAKYACPDMLKIWCDTRFLIPGPYRACASTTTVCNAANAGSKCNVASYNACYAQIAQLGRNYDYCTRQNRMILCASGAACPDMVTYNCQTTTQNCQLTACVNLPRMSETQANEMDQIFSPLFERQLGSSPSVIVIALCSMVAVLAAALVVLVVKIRRTSGAQSDYTEMEQ